MNKASQLLNNKMFLAGFACAEFEEAITVGDGIHVDSCQAVINVSQQAILEQELKEDGYLYVIGGVWVATRPIRKGSTFFFVTKEDRLYVTCLASRI